MKMTFSLFATSSALALWAAGAEAATAQVASGTPENSPPEAQRSDTAIMDPVDNTGEQSTVPAANGQEITVTGSRIRRNGTETGTPVTVASVEQLELAAPSNAADALNQLPQFRGSSRPQAGGVSANAAAGANLLNLRNLGSQRNLVLLDGRRMVPSTNIGVTDVNTLPQALLQRVEVVTGGASAAYGSDAVAGVVNFILNDRFEGIKGELQGGISGVGDSDSRKASVAVGRGFADNQLHVIASAEYYYSSGIGPSGVNRRDWSRRDAGIVPNVPGTATPNRFILDDNVLVSLATFGGLITTGPLINTTFGPGGVPEPFVPGTLRSATFMVGGTGIRHESNISAQLERGSVFSRLTFDANDHVHLFAEGAYSKATTSFDQYYNFLNASTAFTIFSGNAFLPASVQTQLTAQNIPSFRLGRIMGEGDYVGAINTVDVLRGVVGFSGKSDSGFSYDGYYSHGRAKTRIENTNVLNFDKVYAAADAVRAPDGSIACRDTLLFGGHPGCVPLNLFGQGSPSQAAIDYYQDDEYRDLLVTQDVIAVNLQGGLFAVTSEPIKFASGAEYRHESARQTVDPLSTTTINFTNVRGGPTGLAGQVGPFVVGNPQPLAGSVTVKEVYAELDAPLLRNLPLAHSLDLNLAGRLTDYSTSGRVTTWKISASYAPWAELRFRGTRSRDIRAANVSELFAGGVQSTGTIRDPAGVTQNFVGRSVGNPNLNPEKADTLTLGGVFEPSWLPHADVSVDYYDIKIRDAISSLTAQNTIDECARGSQIACSNINIVSGVYRVTLPQLNLAELATSGVDIEVGYRSSFAGGDLALRALVNYQGKFVTTTPGSVPIDRAGEVGQSSNPKWLATASAEYSHGSFTMFAQERFISAGKYNSTYQEGIDINDNTIPPIFYTDLTLRYRIEIGSRFFNLFGTVNNLFDRDPPLAPQQSASVQRYSNFSLYDPIGRYFTIGARFQF